MSLPFWAFRASGLLSVIIATGPRSSKVTSSSLVIIDVALTSD
jgi:hypothetical protein